MIAAYWFVLAAGVMPLGCAYVAKFGPASTGGGPRFDNRAPRAWLARQTGVRARANAAQQNGFEALPLFAAGVIIAASRHAPVATIDLLAATFVVARVAYVAAYLADWPRLRSAAWATGFLACVGLFVVAAGGHA